MLTSLRMQGFKSWADTGEMRLAPITGLFGTNSSGKTSILQFLLMLKQTVESTDRAQVLNLGDDRSLVDLGTFRDIVHGHELPGVLEWSLGWVPPKRLTVPDPEDARRTLPLGDALSFFARICELETNGSPRAVVDRIAYKTSDQDADVERTFTIIRRDKPADRYDLEAEHFDLRQTVGRPWPLPPPVKCYGFPDRVYAAYQNASFLADLQLAFEELFGRVYYLGPLREYPRRQYIWAGGQPSDVGWRGERAVDALLASRDRQQLVSRGRGKSRRLLDWIVADWLAKLGLIHSFRVDPIREGGNLYEIRVKKTARLAAALITDVGFGVSQILPVLVLCYYVPEGSTIILEQPEIHLHPSVQAGLADVLIDAATTRHVQIILESHSEHLLRRLQRRIAEQKIAADQTALYFCEMPGAASKLTELDLDTYGSIRNWPKDFFGDEMGDLVATTEAAISRELAETAG
jgi:predicted ATPase